MVALLESRRMFGEEFCDSIGEFREAVEDKAEKGMDEVGGVSQERCYSLLAQ